MTLTGSWIWYELMTKDAAGAKAFYEKVVGWRIAPGEEAPLFYGHIGNTEGGPTGGLLPLSQDMLEKGAKPGWVGYLAVEDIDAALPALEAHGGTVLMPKTTIDVGSFALVADPDGAPFYLMTPLPPPGGGTSTAFSPTLIGRCGWNELVAADATRALAFYTALFGWELPPPMDMGAYGPYQFISHDGGAIGAIMQRWDSAMPPHWNHYFRVPDIEAATKATEAHGGTIVNGPHQVPGGDWIIQGNDPQGAFFCLVGPKGG